MGHRVALTALGAVAVVGMLGCGGAGKDMRTTPSTSFTSHCDNCGVGLHSPSHHYSVRQVEAAFASQGIELHETPKPVLRGFVTLGYRPDRRITVDVEVRSPKDGTGFAVGYRGHMTSHRNVIAIYDSSHSAAVTAALAELR